MIDIMFWRYNEETGIDDCEFIGRCGHSHEIPKFGHRIKYQGRDWWVKDHGSIEFINNLNDRVDIYLKEYTTRRKEK